MNAEGWGALETEVLRAEYGGHECRDELAVQRSDVLVEGLVESSVIRGRLVSRSGQEFDLVIGAECAQVRRAEECADGGPEVELCELVMLNPWFHSLSTPVENRLAISIV